MDFATSLREQIVAHNQTRRGKRLLDLIDSKPSAKRTRILARLEAHAKTALAEHGYTGIIDWSKVDWAKVFDIVFKILMALLPLLLAL